MLEDELAIWLVEVHVPDRGRRLMLMQYLV
uniref:Uncharacterized protein n=1 Tax=Arundo donax TaxID=35708 RepID=A0A0A8YEC0_ARUDO